MTRSLWIALALLMVAAQAFAFTVNAGGAKTLVLPSNVVPLFGTTSATNITAAAWTKVSGPGSVTFSAPSSCTTAGSSYAGVCTTIASMSVAGSYTVQLSVNDGTGAVTDTASITVANADSTFYVDPDYAGATRNGAATNPWKSLTDGGAVTAPWTVLDASLSTGNVVVYFSARATSSDTNQTTTTSLQINRTDTSTHRIVLDGMSQYNTNDTTPSWSAYTGNSRFEITGSEPIGTNNDVSNAHRDYWTARGFHTIGNGGTNHVFICNSSHIVYEYGDHTINSFTNGVSAGPGLIVAHRPIDDTNAANYATDILLYNNNVHNNQGEGIYLGGSSPNPTGHLVQTNTNVLIESNTITDPGDFNGAVAEQGDGIDIKDGNVGVVVRGNTVKYTQAIDTGQNNGLVAESFALIENNYFETAPDTTQGGGLKIGCAFSTNTIGRFNGVIRNNLIINAMGIWGMNLGGCATPATNGFSGLAIYNNSILMTTSVSGTSSKNAVALGTLDAVSFSNNILAAKNANIDTLMPVTSVSFTTHNNNVYWRNGLTNLLVDSEPGSNFYSSANLSSWESNSKYGDPNYTAISSPYSLIPQSGSNAIDAGLNLSGTGFTLDYRGTTRPVGSAWDIGAFEVLTGVTFMGFVNGKGSIIIR